MQNIYSTFLMAVAMAGSWGYSAEAQTPEPRVITVGESTGTLTNANGVPSRFASVWTSSGEEPTVRIVVGDYRNNMAFRNGNVACWVGTIPAGKTYTVTTTGNYYIAKMEMDVVSADAGKHLTVTIGGESFTTSDTEHHVSATYNEGDAVTMNFDGSNFGAEMRNFKITLNPTSAPVPEPLEKMVFRYDGTPDYSVQYRIPAIATVCAGTNAGRLVAINDYRYCGADIGGGRIDLYQSISDDNGSTWSTPGHMRDTDGAPVAKGDGAPGVGCGFGDAAIVSDRETGKLLVVACAGNVGFGNSSRSNPLRTVTWTSTDGGDTWSPFTEITEKIYSLFDGEPQYGCIDGQFAGSGRIMQSRFVKVGNYYRIYMAIASRNANGNNRNWVLYSDDFGTTWGVLGGTDTPAIAAEGDESKVEELPDGSVFLAGRCNSGNRHFNIFRYTDTALATGTWDKRAYSQLDLPTPINACNGEVMMIPVENLANREKGYMVLQTVPFGPNRYNVGFVWKVITAPEHYATSDVLSHNWQGRLQVSQTGSAYSTMTWLANTGQVGLFYEEATFGKTYCGVYRNFTVEEITDNKYAYTPDPDNSIAGNIANGVENVAYDRVAAPVKWFDTMGREVRNLVPGQLYIGSDGTKKIAR